MMRKSMKMVTWSLVAVGMMMWADTGRLSAEEITKAVCQVRPTKGNKTRGVVTFQKTRNGQIRITARINGLNPGKKHAIHIHQFGDCRDLAGKSAGGHFNPTEKPHGLPPSAERHAGDLGNLEADADGKAKFSLTVDNISLGSGDANILGRAIVIHALPDDGGQPTGNAGARIACGVIGIANPEWKPMKKQ